MFVKMKSLSRILIVFLVLAMLVSFLSASQVAAKSKAPKYIIVMISDGWSYNTVLSSSFYQIGKAGRQDYNRFPTRLAMSTYEVENPADNCSPLGYDPVRAWTDFDYVKYPCATDSASAATAMSTGVKTYNGYIGMDVNGAPQWHIMQEAEAKGKATGVVTSVEWSHATPAGFVAHNISRNNYAAIANEMIYQSGTDVIMGAGNPNFNDSGNPSVKDPKYVGGLSTWNDLENGTAGNDADGDGDFDAWTLIQTREEFVDVGNGDTPARVIGVPQVYTTLQQARSGDAKANPYTVPLTPNLPTLVEMTRAALNVLDNDPDGFVLMIEGGAVDWAAHANQSGRMIEEQIDFDNAFKAVMGWVKVNSNWDETLLIVTGDHETGYLTGPMPDPANPTWTPVVNHGARVVPGMQWNFGEHTNQLIPFYAKGDNAHLFNQAADLSDPVRGPYIDNTDIAQVIFQVLR